MKHHVRNFISLVMYISKKTVVRCPASLSITTKNCLLFRQTFLLTTRVSSLSSVCLKRHIFSFLSGFTRTHFVTIRHRRFMFCLWMQCFNPWHILSWFRSLKKAYQYSLWHPFSIFPHRHGLYHRDHIA